MSVRQRLDPIEQTLAYFMGLGLAIILLAFWLGGLENVDTGDATGLLIVGATVLVLSTIAWMYFSQPWKSFGNFEPVEDQAHASRALVTAESHLPAVVEAPGLPVPVETQDAAEPVPVEMEAEPEAAMPVTEEPLPFVTDTLTQITGIGARVARGLNDAGITTLAQIAAMSPEDLANTVREQGVRLVGSTDTWPAQAQALLDDRSE